MNLNEVLYATVSATVSGVDNVPVATMQQVGASAFLANMTDLIRKLLNRIDSPSATITIGGSTGAVELTQGVGAPNAGSGIFGRIHGVPIHLSGAGALSGAPTSLISTASNTVRKVLVTLRITSAFGTWSSLPSGGATIGFVYGSAYATSAGVASTGGASATFNKVPLPKPSAHEIPIGWLNVPNSFAVSAAISAPMMIADLRETQGLDLSAIMGTVVQP